MKTEHERKLDRVMSDESVARKNLNTWLTHKKFCASASALQHADIEVACYRQELEELGRVRRQLERDHTARTGELGIGVPDGLMTCVEG